MNRGLLTDMLKYLPAQVVPGIIGLVSIPVVTRLFLPAEYGDYSLVAATVMVLSTLFGWLPTSVIRYYPAYARQGRLGLFNATMVRLAAMALIVLTGSYYAALLMLRAWMPARLWLLLMIGGLLFNVTCVFNLLQYFLRSKRLVGRYSTFAVWNSAAGFGLAMAFIFLLGFGIEGLLLGAILSIALVLPLLWRRAIGRSTCIRFHRIDPQTAKDAFTYGMPLVAGNLAAWILALSDRYVLGLFRGSGEVGVYSLSYNIADKSLMLLVALFMMASGPIGMYIWENRGRQESMRFITGVTRLYLLACVPIAVGLSVLSRLVVCIMAGTAYAEGSGIMPYVLFGVLLLGVQQQYHWGLLYHHKTGAITLATVAAGLLNVALNVLFVPQYGYMAAAMTTLASYAVLLFLMVWLSRRVFVWDFPCRSLFNAAAASAVMGTAVHYLHRLSAFPAILALIASVGAGVIVYVVVLLALREFSSQELEALRRMMQDVRARMPSPTSPVDGT